MGAMGPLGGNPPGGATRPHGPKCFDFKIFQNYRSGNRLSLGRSYAGVAEMGGDIVVGIPFNRSNPGWLIRAKVQISMERGRFDGHG